MLKYEGNYIPYALDTVDVDGFAANINADEESAALSDLKHLADQLEPKIHKAIASKKEL
ncbi:hypothetical protein FJQ98_12890 [Lysinibacillus agricola]|uniref:Uncharacterized protein n=1 Tax=Lysinibacillus agricola TaxID=2590012 RepID=A0ABX7ALC1_9BACI|nr:MULTISPECIES: hypothetical protein [Lysinibacillus]QQP10211.1 hypothetical protein FJQ98_12890 [Lysinibacillus agricola]